MKKIAVVGFLLLGYSATQAQWPAQSQTTKPWTRWWWMGSAVDEKGLTSQLNSLQNVGFGGGGSGAYLWGYRIRKSIHKIPVPTMDEDVGLHC